MFPDPDNEGSILYMPNDLEICNGSAAELPDVDDYLPIPPGDSSSDDMDDSDGEGYGVMSEEEGEVEDDDEEDDDYYEDGDEEEEEEEEEEDDDEEVEYDEQ